MIGRVDILVRIFEKSENFPQIYFFGPCNSILTFLQFSQNDKIDLPVILSFMKFFVAQTFWVERHLDVVLEVLQAVG